MQLTHLLMQYGYLALFIGCLLEGETLLLLAGFAAHQGYLSFPLVVLLAFAGGTLGDQFFFILGRRFGPGLIARLPHAAERSQKVHQLLQRHHRWIIVCIRFMYGLRIAGPVIIGSSQLPLVVFAGFNMLGALLWAGLIAGIGYLFGQTGQWLLADLKQVETAAMLVIAAVGVLWLILRHVWHKSN